MIPRLRAALRRYTRSVEDGRRAEVERFAESLLQSGEAFSNLLLVLLRDPEASPSHVSRRAGFCALSRSDALFPF